MAVVWREEEIPVLLNGGAKRKRWTREELDAVERLNFFQPGAYELLEGELFEKMGKHPPHTYVLMAMLRWLRSTFGADFLHHEATIDVSPEDNPTNQPQPDAVVLRESFEVYASRYPGPADIRLIVEVADSSLEQDLRTKRDLYARAGIPEYWVVDLNSRRMIVHRTPVEGKYTDAFALSPEEAVAPLESPERELLVESILPPSQA